MPFNEFITKSLSKDEVCCCSIPCFLSPWDLGQIGIKLGTKHVTFQKWKRICRKSISMLPGLKVSSLTSKCVSFIYRYPFPRNFWYITCFVPNWYQFAPNPIHYLSSIRHKFIFYPGKKVLTSINESFRPFPNMNFNAVSMIEFHIEIFWTIFSTTVLILTLSVKIVFMVRSSNRNTFLRICKLKLWPKNLKNRVSIAESYCDWRYHSLVVFAVEKKSETFAQI